MLCDETQPQDKGEGGGRKPPPSASRDRGRLGTATTQYEFEDILHVVP
jgi:hypothetical protein